MRLFTHTASLLQSEHSNGKAPGLKTPQGPVWELPCWEEGEGGRGEGDTQPYFNMRAMYLDASTSINGYE